MKERWKPVPGYEDRYWVSDLGNVWTVRCRRLLRPGRMSSGHLSVALGRNNSVCVHVLVLTAFRGEPRPGHEGRHRNGMPDDNRLVNLQWSTRARNTQDKKWHRLPKTGKLTGPQARRLKQMLKRGVARKDVASMFGVSVSTVHAIVEGRFHCDV